MVPNSILFLDAGTMKLDDLLSLDNISLCLEFAVAPDFCWYSVGENYGIFTHQQF
jgi:hypothetical protein